MKYKVSILLLALLYSSISLFSQSKRTISFNPFFGNTNLKISDTAGYFFGKDSLQITTFKFYVSDITLISKKTNVWKETNSFHLIDFSKPSTLSVSLNIPVKQKFKSISFMIGIDSATNYAGALGGDLDPTKGMYWTWQNGYINIKLEGRSNKCRSANHQFQFHLGGYNYPFATIQKVTLKIKNKSTIYIKTDVKKLVDSLDFEKQNHIMSPGLNAVNISQKVPTIFSTKMP